MTTALRRTVFLVVLAVLGGAAYSWWNGRKRTLVPATAPEWPPITVAPDSAPLPDPTWAPADADGSCPSGFPIKVKTASGIYHAPGGRFYERTRPDRCYATAEAAETDGYRPSKS